MCRFFAGKLNLGIESASILSLAQRETLLNQSGNDRDVPESPKRLRRILI